VSRLVLLALLGAAAPADAQELVHEPEPPPVYVAELRAPARAVLGLDFGIGMLDALCDGCYAEGGLSLDLFGGVQVARRVALLADAWGLLHLVATDDDQSGIAALALATAGARVWIIPRLWLQAGVGAGALLIAGSGADDGADFGPGLLLAVGGEPGHKRWSGIDLSLRIGATWLTDASASEGDDRVLFYGVAAVVGYHWN